MRQQQLQFNTVLKYVEMLSELNQEICTAILAREGARARVLRLSGRVNLPYDPYSLTGGAAESNMKMPSLRKLKSAPDFAEGGEPVLHVDDLARACIFIMEKQDLNPSANKETSLINIGSGNEITIRDLAIKIKDIIQYEGVLEFDNSKLDGTPRKLLDVSQLEKFGWQAKTSLEKGIKLTIKNFEKEFKNKSIRL